MAELSKLEEAKKLAEDMQRVLNEVSKGALEIPRHTSEIAELKKRWNAIDSNVAASMHDIDAAVKRELETVMVQLKSLEDRIHQALRARSQILKSKHAQEMLQAAEEAELKAIEQIMPPTVLSSPDEENIALSLVAGGRAASLEGAEQPDSAGSKPNAHYAVFSSYGHKIDVKVSNGKTTISIPTTEGMSIAEKAKLAKGLIETALLEGAYSLGQDGLPVFKLKTNDPQLASAVRAQVELLGYTYEGAALPSKSQPSGLKKLFTQDWYIKKKILELNRAEMPEILQLQGLESFNQELSAIIKKLKSSNPATVAEAKLELQQIVTLAKALGISPEELEIVLNKADPVSGANLKEVITALEHLKTKSKDVIKAKEQKIDEQMSDPKTMQHQLMRRMLEPVSTDDSKQTQRLEAVARGETGIFRTANSETGNHILASRLAASLAGYTPEQYAQFAVTLASRGPIGYNYNGPKAEQIRTELFQLVVAGAPILLTRLAEISHERAQQAHAAAPAKSQQEAPEAAPADAQPKQGPGTTP